MLPANFATWRAVSSAPLEQAALVDLVATAPALRTLDVECAAPSRSLQTCWVSAVAPLRQTARHGCDPQDRRQRLQRLQYPAWKALMAAQSFTGSNKLIVA